MVKTVYIIKSPLKIGDVVLVWAAEKWEPIPFIKEGSDGSVICVCFGHEKAFHAGLEFGTMRWLSTYWKRKDDPPTYEVTIKQDGKEIKPSDLTKEQWDQLRETTK